MSRTKVKKIMLWSSPRNISTALMYSFAQRSDTKVVDEPFYAYYLTHVNTKVDHPGKREIINSQSSSLNEIVNEIEMFMEKDVLFIKNMTHHLAKTNVNLSRDWYHVILTRSPQSAYISFKKVISNPTVLDMGYKEQYAIALKFKKKNIPFYILSSEELLNSPKKELENLCDYLKINFDNNMLSWDRGGIKEDGIWAKYWYENVHKSHGFKLNKKMDDSKRIENDTITISSIFYHKLLALKK
tara:strand:+ start:607 stop:1332 length:726 start_codon:yes stop_codon:yes gene_type:complete